MHAALITLVDGDRYPGEAPKDYIKMFKLSEMDYVRGALANALSEDMTLIDLWQCSIHAKNTEDFDKAVNLLAQMVEQKMP